ncbi:hypothetical protein CMO91_03775 [Candidatus Woesearchaeota archaeon]|nr:hypothetical protein [Candidatus Woesearchaeota archaeon]|tara:strand:+ start:1474 stop:1887 length:414 start_codon:yes stop_codon:yes gene_type:complete
MSVAKPGEKRIVSFQRDSFPDDKPDAPIPFPAPPTQRRLHEYENTGTEGPIPEPRPDRREYDRPDPQRYNDPGAAIRAQKAIEEFRESYDDEAAAQALEYTKKLARQTADIARGVAGSRSIPPSYSNRSLWTPNGPE